MMTNLYFLCRFQLVLAPWTDGRLVDVAVMTSAEKPAFHFSDAGFKPGLWLCWGSCLDITHR